MCRVLAVQRSEVGVWDEGGGVRASGEFSISASVSWHCRGALDAHVACCTVGVKCGGAFWLVPSLVLPSNLFPSLLLLSLFTRICAGAAPIFAKSLGLEAERGQRSKEDS